MKNPRHQSRFFLVLESLIYSSGQMLLGLFLHPYRSMQLLTKNKVLFLYVFYPSFFIFLLYLFLRINFIFNLYEGFFIFRFFYQVFSFFCFYYQLALFYLWFRFSRAFAKS